MSFPAFIFFLFNFCFSQKIFSDFLCFEGILFYFRFVENARTTETLINIKLHISMMVYMQMLKKYDYDYEWSGEGRKGVEMLYISCVHILTLSMAQYVYTLCL